MRRYNVKSKQDISGIAILTNNPIAIDNIRTATLKNVAKQSIGGKVTKHQ